jgi:hypothetical protein
MVKRSLDAIVPGVYYPEGYGQCQSNINHVPCVLEQGHTGDHAEYLFGGRYPNKERNWIQYPMDHVLRKELFVPEAMQHPAKANIHMMEDIWRYVSRPGETILDPFGGVGTTMLAAREGRRVILCELEPLFYLLQQQSLEKMEQQGTLDTSMVMTLQGDNRKVLPISVDHVMTSPPYAGILVSNPKAESSLALTGSTYGKDIGIYSDHVDSIARLPKFRYNMEMTKVYQLCYDSLRPGGTLTSIIMDYTKDGERVYLSSWFTKVMDRIGFEIIAWFKRYSKGTGYKALAKSKGAYVVEDEDIIVARRPA